ncbi:MAG: plasmid pRiA4b ORF-3 family protein [Acidimicrobiales bacterium]
MANERRSASPKTVIQLRISLMVHTPTIWRRLLVPGEIKLSKLHSIFQAAMGWEDYHLHLFKIGGISYGEPDEEFENDDSDEDSVLLSRIIEAPLRFTYQYDFGDNWRHEVVVESIEPVPLVLKFATCLDGQRACPPEDCGGVGGFEEFLEAISDPGHEEHDDYVGWVGRPFDPGQFSVAAANAALQRVR